MSGSEAVSERFQASFCAYYINLNFITVSHKTQDVFGGFPRGYCEKNPDFRKTIWIIFHGKSKAGSGKSPAGEMVFTFPAQSCKIAEKGGV